MKLLESRSVRADDPINLTLKSHERDAICLDCALADCVGIESMACPIRIEQRRRWREKNAERKAQRRPEAELGA